MTFVRFFTAKRPQTPAAPRRGGGMGPLSYKNHTKVDPGTRPAPEALLFTILKEALLMDLGYLDLAHILLGQVALEGQHF